MEFWAKSFLATPFKLYWTWLSSINPVLGYSAKNELPDELLGWNVKALNFPHPLEVWLFVHDVSKNNKV